MDFTELTAEPIDITSVARRVVPPECGATVTLDGYARIPAPYSKPLELAMLPHAGKIVAAVKQAMYLA